MHRSYGLLSLVLLFCGVLVDGYAFSFQSSTDTSKAILSSEDNQKINELLRHYEAAYDRRSLDDLQKIWPNLASSKDFKKIKAQFQRGDVLSTKVNLTLLDQEVVELTNTVLRCSRTEEDVQSQKDSDYNGGDLSINRMPVQNPGPTRMDWKRTVRKTADIWVTVHKTGPEWSILSVNEKKQH